MTPFSLCRSAAGAVIPALAGLMLASGPAFGRGGNSTGSPKLRNEACRVTLEKAEEAVKTWRTQGQDRLDANVGPWTACHEPGVDARLVARAALLRIYAPPYSLDVQKKLRFLTAAYDDLVLVDARGPEAIRLLDHIGSCQVELGRHAEALRIYEQSLGARREAFGPRSPQVAHKLIALARGHASGIWDGRKDEERAVAMATEAFEMLREDRGENDAVTAAALWALADILKEVGRPEEAEALEDRATDVTQRLTAAERKARDDVWW
jgi:tetratricopeptide (TPR) repeat protein